LKNFEIYLRDYTQNNQLIKKIIIKAKNDKNIFTKAQKQFQDLGFNYNKDKNVLGYMQI